MVETEEWGFRELAYRIKGERRGFYVRLDYGGNGATMNEVERNLKLSDGVLRYLSVLVDEAAEWHGAQRYRGPSKARGRSESRDRGSHGGICGRSRGRSGSAAEAQAVKERAAAATAALPSARPAESAPESALRRKPCRRRERCARRRGADRTEKWQTGLKLCGRLASAPTLRVTPAGTAVLSMVVEAGEKAGELPMPVVMTGESARALATRLKAGVEVRVAGALRATRSRVRPAAQTSGLAGVEVIADEITLVDAAGQGFRPSEYGGEQRPEPQGTA